MIKEISPQATVEKMKANPDSRLVDVREDWERDMACIEGSIQLTEELAEEMESQWPKDTEIIFQCHHGGRSMQAAHYFQEKGFNNIYNLTGGIDAWSLQVDSSLARY